MAREIKFRFWNDNEIQGIRELKTNSILDMAWEWDEVEEYTGLTDKNGKESYYNDISEDENGDKNSVKWDDEEGTFYLASIENEKKVCC